VKVTKAVAGFVAFPAIILAASACSDKTRDQTPTGVSSTAAVPFGLAAERSSENEGSGSNFKVFGDARLTRDPENPTNVVLQINSNADFDAAGVFRRLKNVQLWQLDHQLNLKYAFVTPHSCGGGSPRMILIVDADGDGKFNQFPNGQDFALNGHFNPPATTGCPTSFPTASNGGPSPSTLLWRWEDFTDDNFRWEVTPGNAVANFPAFPGPNWDAIETLISAAFPRHRVLEADVLEDFVSTPPGTVYLDLITVFDLTLGTRGQVEPERGNRDNHDD
jgi:hypothetical protein